MSRAPALALVALSGVSFWACNAAFGIGDLTFEERGGSTSSSGGGGSGGSGGIGGTTSSSSSSTSGGGGAGGDGGMGGAAPTLVSRGLLARYYLDEPAGVQVLDAAPDPLDLTMSSSDNMERVTAPGRSGIQWMNPGSGGVIAATVDGTKIEALDGSTTATIEIVVEVTALNAFDRFLHIGKTTDSGRLTFNAGNGDADTVALSARSDGDEIERWDTPLVGAPRQVFHVVIDTSISSANRARLFADGDERPAKAVIAPFASGEGLELDNGLIFSLGNRPSQNRSMAGTLYYAALYSVALDETERANNIAILTVSDDAP